jgi:CheY-like chemotaxis protein
MVRFLKESGCEVDMVGDGASGLDRVQRGRYHVIVLDWRLPDQSGFDVLRQLWLRGCRIPILVLSGYADIELAVEAMQLGASAVKAKPIRPEKLLAVLRALGPAPGGPPLPPWTARTCALLEELHAACADDTQESQMSGHQVVQRFAMTLVEPDITIPEVFAGLAAFKALLSTPALDADLFAHLRRLLIGGIFDQRLLLQTVAFATARLEACSPDVSGSLSEEGLAAELSVSLSYLSELLVEQTPLRWGKWKAGVRFRFALRDLACGSLLIKEIAALYGWSSPEQFTHQCGDLLGLSPVAFRGLFISSSQH